MNIRLGKSGKQECISIGATALAVLGIFGEETETMYRDGNSSYVTLPFAVIISLAVFLLLSALIKKSGCANLGEWIKRGLNSTLGTVAANILLTAFIFSAYEPLSKFTRAMHGLFYEGVSYSSISLFVIPPVLILSILGLETIVRTAKCYVFLLAAVFAVAVVEASTGFELYRIYPFPGSGLSSISRHTIDEIGLILPVLLALLVTADGFNGIETARKAGIIASLIAAVICFVAQFALALTYTYKELSNMFMPLFRINYLNMFEPHLLRTDKLANMTWLNGALLSGGFFIYAGARLTSQFFSIRDIRPVCAVLSFITLSLILIETESKNSIQFRNAADLYRRWSIVVVMLPLLFTVILNLLRGRGKKLETI